MNLSKALLRYAGNRRRLLCVNAFLRLMMLDVFLFIILCVADNLFGLPVSVRAVAASGIIGFNAGYLVHFTLRAFLAGRIPARKRALELEKFNQISDNRLVNAVCFADDPSMVPELQRYFQDSADRLSGTLRFPSLFREETFRRLAGLLLLALVAGGVYLFFFGAFARNACIRLLRPNAEIQALNFIRFEVTPGNGSAPKGGSVTVSASAYKNESRLSNLKVLVKGAGSPALYPMEDGKFTFSGLDSDLTYRILADDEKSREYRISVLPAPEVSRFDVFITRPAYTGGRKTVHDGRKLRVLEVLPGSKISIHAECSGSFFLNVPDGEKKLPYTAVMGNGEFPIRPVLENKNGMRFENLYHSVLRPASDLPPVVSFANPKKNIEAGYGEVIPLRVQSSDDYGLDRVRISVHDGARAGVLRQYSYPLPGVKKSNEVFLLKITPEILPANGSVEVRVDALDFRKQTAKTPDVITIHFADLEKLLREKAADGGFAGKCYESIFAALTRQNEVRDRTAHLSKRFPRWEINPLVRGQEFIQKKLHAAERFAAKAKLPFGKKIAEIRKNHADRILEDSRNLPKNLNSGTVNAILLRQTALIAELKKLTGQLALAERKKEQKNELLKKGEAEKELFAQMQSMRDKINRFKTEQKKIIAETEKFDPKKAEDYSEAEEKLLGELAEKELELGKFLKSAFSDLSKLQDQDFSNSAMADEFVTVYEELQKSGDALKAKKIEIATLAEDTALDSSNAIAANIERWLADKVDYIKWVSEEDGKSQDTDLTDLPAELTDIIGDLIEQEDDMADDTSDGTNSFSYDSDEALGWGVSDGTIDSMQAKGITGNVLPNNNEVGGRSGEGRSGRSSGQYVEKEAHGKGGGRRTPTRLQQSPFEKGTVADHSKEGHGGATGGGKQSGVGGEGLAGVTPDQDQRTGIRPGGNQAELKQRTAALLKRLNDSELPTGDLRDALSKLRAAESAGGGSGAEVRRLRVEAASALKRAKLSIESAVLAEREQIRRRKRDSIGVKHGGKEKVPPAYEECVGEYFRALAVEDAKE